MNRDISDILAEWPYDPGKVNVRMVTNQEGEPLIQIRLDLGILQLRYDGRPDGQTINGYASLLEYFEARLDGIEPPEDEDEPKGRVSGPSRAKSGPAPKRSGSSGREEGLVGARGGEREEGDEPDGADQDPGEPSETSDEDGADSTSKGRGAADEEDFVLSPEDCRALRDEAAQYYHRYVALLILEDFEGVVRDTTRNLRVLDLCAQFAEQEDDRQTLEQFRPYIMMMRARAMASQALRDNETKAAVVALDEGLDALRRYYSDAGEADEFAGSNEAAALREMREALVPKLPSAPPSQAAELRQRLQRAIDQENYELAAILRDELRLLQERAGGPQA